MCTEMSGKKFDPMEYLREEEKITKLNEAKVSEPSERKVDVLMKRGSDKERRETDKERRETEEERRGSEEERRETDKDGIREG